MPQWSAVTRAHVLAALKEYDDLGDREFRRRYGFGRAKATSLWHDGREYDPHAVLGVAAYRATGTPSAGEELPGDEHGSAQLLSALGFDVVVDEEALASQRSRRAKPTRQARSRPAATRDATPKVCPTCHMALPASGVCDFCD